MPSENLVEVAPQAEQDEGTEPANCLTIHSSQPVHVDGVDFEIVVCTSWERPVEVYRVYPQPIRVEAGECKTVIIPAHLVHTRIHNVRLGLETGTGWNWLTNDVLPGKYQLSLFYVNDQPGHEAWLGKVQTDPLEIEVR